MKNFSKQYGPWALITGASSGIGREMARQIAAKKVNVVIVARRQNLLEELKNELSEQYGVQVRILRVDLLKHDAIKQLEAATLDLDIGLIIPNAGAELVGEFVETGVEKNSALVQLNTLVPMQIASVFGQRLKKRGSGGVLFVSSLFGYQGIPYLANYAATKAYILSLGEALHVELAPYGVDVCVLSPGLTETEMTENMAIDFNKMPIFSMKPAVTARIGLQALGNKVSVVPGLLNKIYAWENRFIPRTWPVALFGFLICRAWKQDAQALPHQELCAKR